MSLWIRMSYQRDLIYQLALHAQYLWIDRLIIVKCPMNDSSCITFDQLIRPCFVQDRCTGSYLYCASNSQADVHAIPLGHIVLAGSELNKIRHSLPSNTECLAEEYWPPMLILGMIRSGIEPTTSLSHSRILVRLKHFICGYIQNEGQCSLREQY